MNLDKMLVFFRESHLVKEQILSFRYVYLVPVHIIHEINVYFM